jgi:pimeloyl-ACP methyl ester carboxylesterase
MADDIRHALIPAADGVRLHVAAAGPEDGPPVILLHGFPEPWTCWRNEISPLAGAGYLVLAPDQRGYGTSDRPGPVAAYALDRLAADVLGIIEATGRPKAAALVGHDWGGIVAWWVAIRHPERLERLVVLNAPHPVAFRRHLRSHPRQMMRSSYALFFQIPGLPEWLLRRGYWRRLASAMRRTSRPGTFTEAELDEYRRAWSEPGAMTAMLHWYRAALRHRPGPPTDPRVRVPVLLIWGSRDRFLGRDLAPLSLALCDRGRLEFLEEATHWVQHEEPERVNRLLMNFLRNDRTPEPQSTP